MKNPLSACASYFLLLEKILIMPRLRYELTAHSHPLELIVMLKLIRMLILKITGKMDWCCYACKEEK